MTKAKRVEHGREAVAAGARAERRALTAIKALRWARVWTVRPATRAEDQAGIDIVVDTRQGELYLQVKSAIVAARRWRKAYPELRAGVVIIRRGASNAEVRAAVGASLLSLYEKSRAHAAERI